MRNFLFYLSLGIVLIVVGRFLPESEYKYFIMIGFTVLAIVSYNHFFDTKRLSKKEKETVKNIEVLKNSGKALALESQEPLNAHDIARLNSRKRFLIFTYVFGVFFIGGFIFFVIHVLVESSARLFIEILVVGLVVVGFVYLCLKEFKKFNHVIREGRKTVVRGIVTAKPVEGDENSDIYFLVIDTVKVKVKEKIYDKYKIGDGIEIHIFKPHNNLMLFETKFEDAGLKDTE